MAKEIDEVTKDVEAMVAEKAAQAEKMDAQLKSMEEKMEEILKAQASQDKAQIADTVDKAKEVGVHYGYASAKKEVESGKTSRAPLWDDRTEKRFVEYVQMVKEKDKGAIAKAYGDLPYTETTTAGGYLVPAEFSSELLRMAYLSSTMLPKVRIIPMAGTTLNMNGVTAGTVGWGAINTQIVDSKLALTQSTLTAEKLVGLSIVPNELIADSVLPIGSFLADEFSEAFALKIDEEILDGNSSDTSNHKFDGWGYASSVTALSSPAADDAPTFAKEVTTASLIGAVAALQAVDTRHLDGAEWFVHPTVWAVIRGLVDSNGNPLVQIDQNYMYNLLGFPVVVNSKVPVATTVALPFLFFGNPKNIFFGDRMGFSLDSSADSRFSYDQTEFRAIQRCGLLVAKPASIGRMSFGVAE